MLLRDARRRLVILSVLAGAAACSPHDELPEQRARSIEARLFAPCCWVQTLDVHESPVAIELRAEIARRVDSGESPLAIEDDMAARFGERIRAIPRGAEPRGSLGLALVMIMLATLAIVGLAVRRWVRRGQAAAAPVSATPRDRYDDLVDRELTLLDD